MVEKAYPVSFEIAGPSAMFTRPDTGSSPVSYPAPTKSAAKSMFEAVVFGKDAYFVPCKVEICSPVIYHKYTTNYGGPLRKSGTVNFQIFATVLENVCYKIYGEIKSRESLRIGYSPKHKLQEIFMRRLRMGQFHSTPFLGWKEFVPSYFGTLRDETTVDESINLTIVSMLDLMYDTEIFGQLSPSFKQDVEIVQGVLDFDQ
jgi:CRISPR-associated protein Cas5d